jgi:predicted nucleic acid-binding protein
MNVVFVDSVYWIARLDPRDQWHSKSKEADRALAGYRLYTTYEIMTELLAFYAGRGMILRRAAADTVARILANPNITVVPQTRELFEAAFSRYTERVDKEWSLTDCISMLVMERNGIAGVLTHDMHFSQAGFKVLLT